MYNAIKSSRWVQDWPKGEITLQSTQRFVDKMMELPTQIFSKYNDAELL